MTQITQDEMQEIAPVHAAYLFMPFNPTPQPKLIPLRGYIVNNHPDVAKQITALIQEVDTPERRQQYRDGDFPRSDRVNDLDMRYRWDLLWNYKTPSLRIPEKVTDNHIDTLLRQLVPSL